MPSITEQSPKMLRGNIILVRCVASIDIYMVIVMNQDESRTAKKKKVYVFSKMKKYVTNTWGK